MKQKVGRPLIGQTKRTIKLDNHLLDFWNETPNKNRMVNTAIEKLKNEKENDRYTE